MLGKSERLKLEIEESITTEARIFSITLKATAKDFLLTDLLRQRGVVDALHADLKQPVKGATARYLNAAETLVAGLVTRPMQRTKARTNGDRKVSSRSPYPEFQELNPARVQREEVLCT